MALQKPVRILVTGGTIDKIHDPETEALTFCPNGTSHIPEILANARCHFPEVTVLMQVDSLQMTDKERDRIADAIMTAKEDALLVTHGTSTMEDTARYLQDKISGKTVILTGAMRPHSLFLSDGPFNVGGALIAAQTLPPGIYGVMNGLIFDAENLRKNVKRGRFDV